MPALRRQRVNGIQRWERMRWTRRNRFVNIPAMPSVELLLLIFASFVIAGFVKGVIGLGLPSVSLALLTATIGLKPAMAVLILPALFTNIFQGLSGGAFTEIIKRTWMFVAAAFLCTWIGAGILAGTDSPLLAALLGVLIATYAVLSLTTPKFTVSQKWERPLNPVIGGIAGIVTGLTGSFVVPGVMYLQALNFPKDKFIQSMGIIFTMATLSLGIGLGGHGLMTVDLVMLSGFALIPSFIGMHIGIKVRNRLDEVKFRKVFFVALLILGAYIVVRSLL